MKQIMTKLCPKRGSRSTAIVRLEYDIEESIADDGDETMHLSPPGQVT